MFDTELFIHEVKLRPALYNMKIKDYTNRTLKYNYWLEIGSIMYKEWDLLDEYEKDEKVKDMNKKWKAVRDAFVKEYKVVSSSNYDKDAPHKKQYVFYEHLLFIAPFIKSNLNASNIASLTEQDDDGTGSQRIKEEMEEDPSGSEVNLPSVSKASLNRIRRRIPKRRFDNQNFVSSKRAAVQRSIDSSVTELSNVLASSIDMLRKETPSDEFGHRAFLLSFLPVLNTLSLNQSMLIRSQISEVFTNYFLNQ